MIYGKSSRAEHGDILFYTGFIVQRRWSKSWRCRCHCQCCKRHFSRDTFLLRFYWQCNDRRGDEDRWLYWRLTGSLFPFFQLWLFNLHCDSNRVWHEVLGAEEVCAQGFGNEVSQFEGSFAANNHYFVRETATKSCSKCKVNCIIWWTFLWVSWKWDYVTKGKFS